MTAANNVNLGNVRGVQFAGRLGRGLKQIRRPIERSRFYLLRVFHRSILRKRALESICDIASAVLLTFVSLHSGA